MDWSQAAQEERKILYSVCTRLAGEHGMTLDELMGHAFSGRFMGFGLGYRDNFRAGRIARRKAATLYRWIRNYHPEYADEIDRAIAALYGSQMAETGWEAFLKVHGEFANIALEDPGKHQQQQHQVQIQTGPTEPIKARIALNQPFRLLLTSPIAGHMIALQWIRGRWVPLRLSPDLATVPISYGRNVVPRRPHGDSFSVADPVLHEPVEVGLHRFVFLILPRGFAEKTATSFGSDTELSPRFLDRLALEIKAMPRATWRAYRTNLMFLISDEHFEIEETELDDDMTE